MDCSGVAVRASWASKIAILFSWLISVDDINFFFVARFCFKVSCRGVFHAIVDDLDVVPVRDEAGEAASSFPRTISGLLNFFARIVSMFL